MSKLAAAITAKVSGRIVTVRVVEIVSVPATRWSSAKTRIEAVSEATGRRITIRSPQRLRASSRVRILPAGINRPEAGFTCPYCQTAWPAASGLAATSPRRRPRRPETGVFTSLVSLANPGPPPTWANRAFRLAES